MCRASFYRIVLSLVALAVGCKRQPDWREYVSENGGFRVSVPATPVESTTPADPLSPSEVDHVLVDRGAAGMFQVTYYSLIGAATMSPETIEAALKLDCNHPFEGSTASRRTPRQDAPTWRASRLVRAADPRLDPVKRLASAELRSCAIIDRCASPASSSLRSRAAPRSRSRPGATQLRRSG